jgi:hypothetical protein
MVRANQDPHLGDGLIDCEEDKVLGAVLVEMLGEADG